MRYFFVPFSLKNILPKMHHHTYVGGDRNYGVPIFQKKNGVKKLEIQPCTKYSDPN